jgi:acetoin utilization deacetylase AcuC-like enzyme
MPSKTGFIFHERFLEHDTGPGHPERPDRLRAIVDHLKKIQLWPELRHLLIDAAPEEYVLQAHSGDYLRFLDRACREGITIFDRGDTHGCSRSYDIALLAAGGSIAAVDAVMSGILTNAFCAVRPPGHHAERDTAMGFCLLNNAAIAARYAQKKYGAERIAILDWDVHHGNGTQHIFYNDRSVLYISTHQFPFYPGTGSRAECGTDQGEGYTLNIPLFVGSGDEEFSDAFSDEILPSFDNYRPDLIIISAGFDAHRDDPLANLNLTEESFGKFTRMVRERADRICQGRIISILEGGYNLTALARSVEEHLRVLME